MYEEVGDEPRITLAGSGGEPMSAPVKLVAYLAVLATVLAAGFGLGAAVGPLRDGPVDTGGHQQEQEADHGGD